MYEISIFLKDRLIGRSTFALDEVRIGRSADNEVRIDNPALSRYHASIESVAGIHLLNWQPERHVRQRRARRRPQGDRGRRPHPGRKVHARLPR